MDITGNDKIIMQACESAGCYVVEDEFVFLVRDENGNQAAINYGQESVERACVNLARLGINGVAEWVGKVPEQVAPKPKAHIEYKIEPTSEKMTWFNVLDNDGNIQNAKRLRKADAIELMENLNG